MRYHPSARRRATYLSHRVGVIARTGERIVMQGDTN
jgi:hypothetical protein